MGFAGDLPQVASLGPILVPISVVLLMVHYYLVYKNCKGSKGHVLVGLLGYIAILVAHKGLELGFPKDTGAEQIVALKDPFYNFWHLMLHIELCIVLAITTFSVPFGGAKKSESVKM